MWREGKRETWGKKKVEDERCEGKGGEENRTGGRKERGKRDRKRRRMEGREGSEGE